jgi:hypothetical protein
MKLTQAQLKQMINEELQKVAQEARDYPWGETPSDPEYGRGGRSRRGDFHGDIGSSSGYEGNEREWGYRLEPTPEERAEAERVKAMSDEEHTQYLINLFRKKRD